MSRAEALRPPPPSQISSSEQTVGREGEARAAVPEGRRSKLRSSSSRWQDQQGGARMTRENSHLLLAAAAAAGDSSANCAVTRATVHKQSHLPARLVRQFHSLSLSAALAVQLCQMPSPPSTQSFPLFGSCSSSRSIWIGRVGRCQFSQESRSSFLPLVLPLIIAAQTTSSSVLFLRGRPSVRSFSI